MEQAQYWMWTNKQKQYDLASTGGCDSWEEQAFAENAAAGALGGCIWPPRSYSCTFCKREFRSAQALGGHMNVHRRDRARLKQSEAPQTETFPHNNTTKNSILLPPDTILDAKSQHQTCSFIFNPNIDFDHRVDSTTFSSPVRVSSSQRLSPKNETQYLFPYVQEQSTRISPPKSSLNSEKQSHLMTNSVKEIEFPSRAIGDNIVKANISIPEFQRAESESATTSTLKPNNKRGIVKADLSISLNLVICSNNPSMDSDDDGDGGCKKRRFDLASALKLFNEQGPDVRRNERLRTMNRVDSSIDDVDLELRLGDPPKIK